MAIACALVAPDTETVMGRYLITSALPYINGIKHLGNLAGSMLPADVHARFRRMQGHEVLFICATDEHGTPAELGALEAGIDVRSYCDQQHELQDDVCRDFGLSFDWFGRSSSPQNRELTQHLAERLEEAGLIEERTTPQVYSIDDRRFLPDRYVEGTCPGLRLRERARRPVRQLRRAARPGRADPPAVEDLRLGATSRCATRPISSCCRSDGRSHPRLGRCSARVAAAWPARSPTNGSTRGCRTAAITRDLDWGVPVTQNGQPRPGFENKVFYVWFDAPIEYIAATAEWAEATGGDWRRWWLLPTRAPTTSTYVAVHGQGQRRLPHRELSGDPLRQRRAVEARRPAEGVQLGHLVRRQVLDLRAARRLHGPGARPRCRPTAGAGG